MSKMYVVSRNHLRMIALGIILVVLAYSVWLFWSQTDSVVGSADEPRVINMVVGEFSSTTKKGTEFEVYRWDPGTIAVKQGESVQLRILGVNGDHHTFEIEGMNVKGEIHKGEETVVNFVASQPGIFRLICHNHSDMANQGPMIGYIIVG